MHVVRLSWPGCCLLWWRLYVLDTTLGHELQVFQSAELSDLSRDRGVTHGLPFASAVGLSRGILLFDFCTWCEGPSRSSSWDPAPRSEAACEGFPSRPTCRYVWYCGCFETNVRPLALLETCYLQLHKFENGTPLLQMRPLGPGQGLAEPQAALPSICL